jgi:hypothetical protein
MVKIEMDLDFGEDFTEEWQQTLKTLLEGSDGITIFARRRGEETYRYLTLTMSQCQIHECIKLYTKKPKPSKNIDTNQKLLMIDDSN